MSKKSMPIIDAHKKQVTVIVREKINDEEK